MICFGTGQTAGAAGVYPGINLVDSVDISPGVFRAGKFFKATNHNVANNPKVKKIIQDGRQHLLTTSTSYDVITAEPPPPRSAGSVNLYTREYYELTKRALKPGGIDGTREESYRPPVCMNAFLGYVLRKRQLRCFLSFFH